jgi:hypothetical protein
MKRRGPLSPVRYIRRRSFRRGVRGGSSFWLAVYALFFGRELIGRSFFQWSRSGVPFWRWILALHTGLDLVRKLTSPPAELVAVEKLKPGQFVRIEAIDPATLEGGR